jgi:hypothetical protein
MAASKAPCMTASMAVSIAFSTTASMGTFVGWIRWLLRWRRSHDGFGGCFEGSLYDRFDGYFDGDDRRRDSKAASRRLLLEGCCSKAPCMKISDSN